MALREAVEQEDFRRLGVLLGASIHLRDVASVVEHWPRIPDSVRNAILALVVAVQEGLHGEPPPVS
jgi:hypothetical protein